ncbi:MAG TPA: DMT family transporter [Spirochaetia bacterium]|nr:DMT family transporter [Spirochaetia bacterium]
MSETAPAKTKSKPVYFTHLELLFVVAIWSGTFVSTQVVLTQVTPALSALYRYLVASIILLAMGSKNKERIERADYPILFFLSLTGVTLYYLLQHYGLRYANATDASILISLSPVFMGLISWLLLKERVRPLAVVGLVLAFAGCLLVITNGHTTHNAGNGRLLGDFLILLTAISWALYSIYGKKLLSRYSVMTLIKYTTLVGTLFLIPFAVPELVTKGIQVPNWVGWLNLLYLGGAASVYGYLAWYRALTRLPAVTVGSYLYFRPFLTGIIAAIVLHDKVGLWAVTGGIMVLAGTFLSTAKGSPGKDIWPKVFRRMSL